MENDLCQNHPPHNYNMLITYFITEVDCGSQMKSRRQKHLEKGDEAWNPSLVSSQCPRVSSILTLAFHVDALIAWACCTEMLQKGTRLHLFNKGKLMCWAMIRPTCNMLPRTQGAESSTDRINMDKTFVMADNMICVHLISEREV